MPSPLFPVRLRSPGVRGLVTDQESETQNHQWATTLRNAVINSSNRIAARNGWTMVTTSGNHSDDTEALYEFVEDDDTVYIVSAADDKIYSGTVTLVDRSNLGTAVFTTPTAADWQFVTLNGMCFGFQANHDPIIWEPSSTNLVGQSDDFEDLHEATGYTGTAPNGNAAISTHGRIFAFDDGHQVIKWCVLLNPVDWSSAGAGAVDLRNIWPGGGDIGVALVEWNDFLVVFGERSVLVFSGLDDPNEQFSLAGGASDTSDGQKDTLTGDGLVSRDAVVSVGTQLIYLSRSGLRSLSRALVGENLPLTTIAPQIQLKLTVDIEAALNAGLSIKMVYHRPLSAIIAKIGSKYWYFDVRDPNLVRASQWDSIGWLSAASVGGALYLGQNDGVASYSSFTDGTASYLWEYRSPWVPLTGEHSRTFIAKSVQGFYESDLAQTITLDWAFDYTSSRFTENAALDVGQASEWGEAEFGIGEWGTSGTLIRQDYEASGDGSIIQFGIRTTINGGNFAVQEVDFFGKVGRVSR